jgi:tRNA dimethylallyltransferase
VRALELVAVGAPEDAGAPGADGPDPSQLWTAEMRHPTRLIGLTMQRDALYSRIDQRVETMVAAGAAEEVRSALAAGASITARKAVGFDELQHGDVAAMQLRTRRLAKRQLTWMRKLAHAEIIDVTGRGAQDVAAEIVP